MNKNIGAYQSVNLSAGRRAMINALDLVAPKHYMYGLLEVDVTLARQLIAAQKAQTGEAFSFTAFLVYCLARAVAENKEVQAYLKGRNQLVLFEDVNVGIMVEHRSGDKSTLRGHVVQRASDKTFRQIHREIRLAQSGPVPPGRGVPTWFSSALLLPWPLSGLVKALMGMAMRLSPALRVSSAGTVFVSSVGMFGKGHSGWGITTTPHSLSLVVGSICWKPAVINGQIEPREMLNLSVLFDHHVVDGAPATRFVRRLVELIECGEGLDEIG